MLSEADVAVSADGVFSEADVDVSADEISKTDVAYATDGKCHSSSMCSCKQGSSSQSKDVMNVK
jgi:hypothetical protein